jgi:osmotically-inducible protein OsmY
MQMAATVPHEKSASMESIEMMAVEPMTENESPADIASRLLWDSWYHPVRRVKCTYHDGVLTMEGRLPSFHLKQVAQTVVQGIDGVVRIENRIEVTGF